MAAGCSKLGLELTHLQAHMHALLYCCNMHGILQAPTGTYRHMHGSRLCTATTCTLQSHAALHLGMLLPHIDTTICWHNWSQLSRNRTCASSEKLCASSVL